MGGRKGRLIRFEERTEAATLINEAVSNGAKLKDSCNLLDITLRTFGRWQQSDGYIKKDQRLFNKCTPANKLTPEERNQVISIATSAEYKDVPPHQIVPKLADKNCYVASESTFYRVLKEEKLDAYRGKAKPKTHKKPVAYVARSPNEIWSWDITYLARNIKGAFYYLYMIIDIFSRKIVGYEVYESESAAYAADVANMAYKSEKIDGKELVLHSDNGSPMKGATMLSMLQKLGVVPSFSRPSVSNDNPFSESMFKTLKYCPQFPSEPFDSLRSAREWVHLFVNWYNNEHCHSGIKFVTPAARHEGLDASILENRTAVYKQAKLRNPSRWSKNIRNWEQIKEVNLNPGKGKRIAA